MNPVLTIDPEFESKCPPLSEDKDATQSNIKKHRHQAYATIDRSYEDMKAANLFCPINAGNHGAVCISQPYSAVLDPLMDI